MEFSFGQIAPFGAPPAGGQNPPIGNPLPIPSGDGQIPPEDTRSRPIKRRRDEAEDQNSVIEALCEQALRETALCGVHQGFGIPHSAQRAFAEARKINPYHSKVLEIQFMINGNQALQGLRGYGIVMDQIFAATHDFQYYLDTSSQAHLQAAKHGYHQAKRASPQHPDVLAFEMKFEVYGHLFQ